MTSRHWHDAVAARESWTGRMAMTKEHNAESAREVVTKRLALAHAPVRPSRRPACAPAVGTAAGQNGPNGTGDHHSPKEFLHDSSFRLTLAMEAAGGKEKLLSRIPLHHVWRRPSVSHSCPLTPHVQCNTKGATSTRTSLAADPNGSVLAPFCPTSSAETRNSSA